MSRCFPFPPLGYVKNGIRDEALMESIKFQREEKKARTKRKEEKKQEKKEKEKARENGEIDNKKCRHKKRRREERSQEDQKEGYHQKKRKCETENLEKSGVTEEHGHPVGSENSSDSTLNSNKRQKQCMPLDGRHNSGSVFRIRLPFQRHEDPEVQPREEQPCSASGRTDDAFFHGVYEPAPRPSRDAGESSYSNSGNVGQELTFMLSKEKPRSLFEASKSFAHKTETVHPESVSCGKSPSLVSQFQDLIENWIPPPIQSECPEFDDLEWLFDTKQNLNLAVERCKVGSNGLSDQNLTLWPCARNLPEADIYALPYTVPF